LAYAEPPKVAMRAISFSAAIVSFVAVCFRTTAYIVGKFAPATLAVFCCLPRAHETRGL
jgi:hypothetical protein